MALSFCSNLGSFQNCNSCNNYPERHHPLQIEMPTELLGYNGNLIYSNTFTNPFYELDELFYSSDSYNIQNTPSLSPEIFPISAFDPHLRAPKRQKSSLDHQYHQNFVPNFSDEYIVNSNAAATEVTLPEISCLGANFKVPAANFCVGMSDQDVKKPAGVALPAQSIAARERRRKITEKTQELGKLIPGGNKMNTAEMFHAAYKYVKFLQSQVGILELMGTINKERNEDLATQELQTLVSSPTIQEKLYSEEKCLVPRKFVQILANDQEIQSKPMIMEEVDLKFWEPKPSI